VLCGVELAGHHTIDKCHAADIMLQRIAVFPGSCSGRDWMAHKATAVCCTVVTTLLRQMDIEVYVVWELRGASFSGVFLASTAWSSVFCRFSDDWRLYTASLSHSRLCIMSLEPRFGRLYEELDVRSCSSGWADITSFTIICIYQKPDSMLLVELQDVQIRIEPDESR